MPTVKLYLLGGFQITRDDQPLTAFRSDRARALLAYLALESNRPLTRPHLAKLFWGQYELKVARANLRGTLSNLRQPRQPLHLIHATYHTVQFHVSHPEFWCDLLEWQRQLDTLLLSGRPLPDAQLRKLLQLEFLEGFERIDSPPFLAWLQQRRQHWRMLLNQLHSAQPRADEIVAGVPASTGSPDTGSPDTGLPSSLSGYHPEPQPAGGQEADAALTADRWSAGLAQGWQGLPQDSTLHGREAELAQLRQWLLQERGRLVAILGMGGEGKTALAAHFVHSLAPLGSVTADAARRADLTADLHHDTLGYVLWRSLLNAPPLSEVLQDWLQVLSQQQLSKLPSSLDQQLDLLLGYLQRHRCLLVLDNVESILRSGERAGYYRPGYEDYGQLLQRIAAYPHQSYLLLTSREQPHELDLLPVGNKSVHTLRLAGLTAEAGQAMLRAIGLSGSSEAMSEVVRRYSGNPLGLKLVAVTIQELFAGRIADFLAQETLAFDDIRDVLDQHFARLAELERDLMFWLAIEREALPVSALYDDLVQPPPRRVVLEAVRSLQRRSLLERVDERIYLQNVIIEYMTDRLVTAMSRELADDEMPRSQDFGALRQAQGAEVLPPNQLVTQTYLNRYALVKAQAKEYVRASQVRLLLQPVADFLGGRWSKAAVAMRLQQLLQRLRTEAPLAPGYTAANLLHLLLQLQMDVRGYDFSKLNVWQAYLQGVTLHGINFDQADLTRSVFTTPIGTISSLAFSPGGEWLAAVANGGETCLWRTADRQVWRVLRRANFSAALAFSPALTGGSPQGAQLLACSEPNGTVSLWSLSETSELTEPTYLLRTPGDKVDALAFSPQARAPYLLASASSDNTIQVWEITAEQTRAAEPRLSVQRDHTLPHAQRVIALAFSPDGRTLITGSVDEVVCLWDVGSQLGAGQLRHTWSGCSGALSVLAFSPNGQLVASASADDYTVRLRDVATGQVLHVLDQHRWLVGAIAFSPDSKRIATGSHDQMVRLWDTSTGQLLYTLVGHTYIVWGLAFSPAGQILASGSHDQTVRLWDVQSGHPLYVLSGYPRALRALAHDAHQILASVGHDQLVHLWRVGGGARAHTPNLTRAPGSAPRRRLQPRWSHPGQRRRRRDRTPVGCRGALRARPVAGHPARPYRCHLHDRLWPG